MSIVHHLTVNLSSREDGAANGTLSGATDIVGSVEQLVNEAFAAGSVDTSVAISFTTTNLRSLALKSTKDARVRFGGTDEVQSLVNSGTVSGGTFTATFGAGTTAAIAYNATAATLQTALTGLSTVGAGNLTCTGGPLPNSAVTITFIDDLGKTNVAAITIDSSGLTGGGTLALTTTTAGVNADKTIALKANDPYVWNGDNGYFASPFSATCSVISVSCDDAARLTGRILTS